MSFRRTKSDVCPTLNGGAASFFRNEVLSVFYETTPEAIQDVLPPGLKPYKRPIVLAGINNFMESDFDVPYIEAALYVAAVHEKTGVHGLFAVGMALDADMATILGREAIGYPKKIGAVRFLHEGDHVEGSAERHGIQFYTIKADVNTPPNDPTLMDAVAELLSPPDPQGHPGASAIFNYLWPAYLWIHAEDLSKVPQPILFTAWKTKCSTGRKAEVGAAQIIYQESKHDPWCSLPVEKMLGGIMSYDQAFLGGGWSPEDQYPVDANQYLPHAFYGMDARLD